MQGAPSALEGEIVTFGVVPTYPSSAYGYTQTHEQTQKIRSKIHMVAHLHIPTRRPTLFFKLAVL
jgi:mannose-1-phosphate guanylyltransferase